MSGAEIGVVAANVMRWTLVVLRLKMAFHISHFILL